MEVCFWKRGRVMSECVRRFFFSWGGLWGILDLWFSLVPYGFHKTV